MHTIVYILFAVGAIVIVDSILGLGILRAIGRFVGFNGDEVNATVKNALDVNNDGKVNLEDVKVAADKVEEKVKKVVKKKAMKVKK